MKSMKAARTTTKERLEIEFRYSVKPKNEADGGHRTKTITIGIFDSLEEAVEAGNKALEELSKWFEVRQYDRFKTKGLFGLPQRLATNCCYPTKGIQYFAKITRQDYSPVADTVEGIFKDVSK